MLRGGELGAASWGCTFRASQRASASALRRALPGEACLLTFEMGNEVVSEGGVGAGVAVGGAEAAGARVGPPLHTRRQQLWAREAGRGGRRQKRRTEINAGRDRGGQGATARLKKEREG